MNAKRVSAAAGVVLAAQKQRQTPAGIAAALEAAGLLQSPESAAELVALREELAGLKQAYARLEARCDHIAKAAVSWRKEADGRKAYGLTLRARVAELEALTPAPIQTCQSCGAGYTYGEACSVCTYKRQVAEALGRDLPEATPDPLAYGPSGYRCGCGKDAHSNLTPCAPDGAL
ncbi:hypothetical protein GTY67_26415 [Streptomyces sp. SID8374]|uniref:hypothetical protein n=1 Tax=Streptomyces sp. SID8374 TaxID=2690354 RepID=UPI00136B1A63|nr:hypothetical protein [Streptomyces sp. SID8374]MYX16886.1 hypothetical protein [Streptomyces sp. SID8374]